MTSEPAPPAAPVVSPDRQRRLRRLPRLRDLPLLRHLPRLCDLPLLRHLPFLCDLPRLRRLGLESPAIATGPEPTEDQAGSGSTVIGLAHCPIMTILPRSNQALGSFHPPETRELLKSRFRVRRVGSRST